MEYIPGECWDDENCCYFEGTAEEREEFEFNKFKKSTLFDDEENLNDGIVIFSYIFLFYFK
jgi:hypothetical protein